MDSIIISDKMVQDRFRVKLVQTPDGFFLQFIRYYNEPPFSNSVSVKIEDFEEGIKGVYETIDMLKEAEIEVPDYPSDVPTISTKDTISYSKN